MQYLKEIKTFHISVVSWSPFVSLNSCTACYVCKKLLSQL